MDANDTHQGGPDEPREGQGAGPEDPTRPLGRSPEEPEPRRLLRSREDRVIGGVCGGLGRYFNVDPILFRIGAVGLSFLGGAGLLLYLAGLALIPSEPGHAGAAPPRSSGRSIGVILAVVVAVIVAGPFLVGGGLVIAAVLVPLAALAITGVLVWWLVAGEGPSGEPRDIALRAALGVGVLIVSFAVAIGGAIAAAAGGETVVAVLLIVAGLAIVGGAFVRPVRWLILPAVLLGLSAGSVAAADVTLDGGVGDRHYRPTSMAELRDHYQLGAGQLDIDLRDLDLPRGDTPLEIDMGAGEVRLAVPASVCVATDAEVGVGEARVLGRANSGVDVNLLERPDAPAAASRLLVDAQIGVGQLEIRDSNDPPFSSPGFDQRFDRGFDPFERDPDANAACRGGARAR